MNILKKPISYLISLFGLLKRYAKKGINKYIDCYKRSKWYGKIGIIISTFIVAILFIVLSIDFNLLFLFGKSPSMFTIKDPMQSVASEVYSADGKMIGKYYSENRTPVEFDDISPILVNTLVSTEDERFYHHHGIDIVGIFAAGKDYITHGEARGASTITQQLVKNLFKARSQYSTGLLGMIPGLKIVIMKAKEWITAFKIECIYSKQEILTMYFNTVDFGSNAYGIKTACHTYFNTTPKHITVGESAVLIGLLKATSYYNPKTHPQNSKLRRNVVLGRLFEHHIISKSQYIDECAKPIVLNSQDDNEDQDKSMYFREAVAASLKGWCKENNYDLYTDGLKIYTTLDTRLQAYAEEAANKQMQVIQKNFNGHWGKDAPWRDEKGKEIPNFIENLAAKTSYYKYLRKKYDNSDSISFYLNKEHICKVFDYKRGMKDTLLSTMDSIRYMEHFMHCGFVALEPHTGQVKAWVGDIEYGAWKYDKILSKRQPGSTFKLFVYTEAMNQGMSPCDMRTDKDVCWEVYDKGEKKLWNPHNANGGCTYDTMSLKCAFAQSVNTIAANLAHEIGIENIIHTAHAMGIKTKLYNAPALSLGASDVSLLELVSSYGTVMNDGIQVDPVLVTRIEDRNGKVLYQAEPHETEAIPYESAFLMQQMLRGGLTERGGTSQALWSFDIFNSGTEFGGKTGTSSNHSDAWFVGVSPNLVAGAWVGGEYRCIHFRTGQLGQGSRTALPIFGYFMEKVLKDKNFEKYHAKFEKPNHTLTRDYNCSGYIPHVKDSDSIQAEPRDTLLQLEESE